MKNTKLTLVSPISDLKGFGPKKVHQMNKLGINTIYDLLTYFPFRYNDFFVKNLSQVADGAKVTIKGTISTSPRYRNHRLYFRMLTSDNQNQLWINFFNQPWLQRKLHYGQVITVYGRLNLERQGLNAIKLLNSKQAHQMDATYPSTKGVYQKTIRKAVKSCYDQCHNLIIDFLPEAIKKKYVLESEPQLIHDIQFPSNDKEEKLARRTAKFNDFFLFQMRLQDIKHNRKSKQGIQIGYKQSTIKKFLNQLPFKLTQAQTRCSKQILDDLASPTIMNRLLEGDVGSGKTIVAAIGILATVSAGYQVALMAPTSVLARQHAKNLSKTFKNFNMNIGLLTGDLKPKAKKELLANLADGNIDLIIGTDALIQDDVKFKNLGFSIVDEQHKYGVAERKALKDKGKGVNALSMTATPIPRTSAIISYGDMDLSVIDQLPSGRLPVKTKWIRLGQMRKYLVFIKYLMDHGKQIYAVAPLVQQTEGSNDKLLDAKLIYRTFKYHFPNYRIGLVHGQMDDDKKSKVMKDFQNGKLQMLVATTVVEVGIDAKRADLMIVFNATQEGLSTLHQLRGRVGRNSDQAYCLLVTNNKVSKNGMKRMRIMESTTNGFKIAEADMELRGAGDLLGKTQSGISNEEFKVADVIGDRNILPYAQEEANRIVNEPHWKDMKQNQNLVKILKIQNEHK